MEKPHLLTAITFLFALSTYGVFAYAKSKYDYPGYIDEQPLEVQETLAPSYKKSRKYYEQKVLRDLASTKKEEAE